MGQWSWLLIEMITGPPRPTWQECFVKFCKGLKVCHTCSIGQSSELNKRLCAAYATCLMYLISLCLCIVLFLFFESEVRFFFQNISKTRHPSKPSAGISRRHLPCCSNTPRQASEKKAGWFAFVETKNNQTKSLIQRKRKQTTLKEQLETPYPHNILRGGSRSSSFLRSEAIGWKKQTTLPVIG